MVTSGLVITRTRRNQFRSHWSKYLRRGIRDGKSVIGVGNHHWVVRGGVSVVYVTRCLGWYQERTRYGRRWRWR